MVSSYDVQVFNILLLYLYRSVILSNLNALLNSWIICQSIEKSVEHTADVWQGLESLALIYMYLLLCFIHVETIGRVNGNSTCTQYRNKLRCQSHA